MLRIRPLPPFSWDGLSPSAVSPLVGADVKPQSYYYLPPPLPLPPPPPPPFLSKWYCSFKPLCSVCSFVHVCDCLHFEQIKRCPTKTIVIDLFMYLDTRKTPITFQQATDWATFTDCSKSLIQLSTA